MHSRPEQQDHSLWRPLRVLAALLLLLHSLTAQAHVKWFAPYDIAKPPLPIGEVLTETFMWFFGGSIVFIFGFFMVDRYALRKGYLAKFQEKIKIRDAESIDIMRLAIGIFFILLWAHGIFIKIPVFLTPDLVTHSQLIPWLQLAIGICAFFDRTVVLVGFGIAGLYIGGVAQYGIFHMTDYMIFIGMAYFFMVCSVTRWRWKKTGFVILYKGAGITLMWASIEKFGYPHWTYPMLQDNPGMLMGMTPYNYMLLAGFIEFAISFVMISSASVLARKVAAGLQAVFILAILKFGPIDALGHLMIIVILFILFMRGPTDRIRATMVLREKAIWVDAGFMTALYTFALVFFFIWYYGFHFYYYGW
ncbi:hypothetical protein V8J88_12455 [Massilia sp. W12]|uniref:hypothetical protein n=1 Tax=Massilia sp. W12 TaxID=3126507 RepID=UPI0030CE5146